MVRASTLGLDMVASSRNGIADRSPSLSGTAEVERDIVEIGE